ncbi:MAG: 2,3-diphosphoglycerate-dependent phosphoglycerate mutase [Moraxella sp.]|uniref:2,3-bisphosphoglycerate-dependent phosphoglycerate mutase n=1 Tax=Moraxella sp. TaxID=479 RepID=UPI0026DD8223|nr:2,3-diphosphoglycerate-dependent phosphoglycerate mutase [Moraxella sp.]MDO4449610.1 2,3-diphosphoglycerate-dependent phosphoglycerate mutase [Moraxella sp.]
MKFLKATLILTSLFAGVMVHAQEVSLILLRHGESQFNVEKRFAGWSDTPLTQKGIKQAKQAGKILAHANIKPTVIHVSLLDRAIDTAQYASYAMGQSLPKYAYWHLNERHYGDLEGKTHTEVAKIVGDEQVKIWRRSFDVPPPPLATTDPRSPTKNSRYSTINPQSLPHGESLKQVIDRLNPYWHYALKPTLVSGETVMVVAHSNSLKALSSHIDPSLQPEDITSLTIPNATPVVYRLRVGEDGSLSILSRQVLNNEATQ